MQRIDYCALLTEDKSMHWIQLTLYNRGITCNSRKKVILCNLQLVTSIEDMSYFGRGTKVQYDAENFFYVEETPEEIFALPARQFK